MLPLLLLIFLALAPLGVAFYFNTPTVLTKEKTTQPTQPTPKTEPVKEPTNPVEKIDQNVKQPEKTVQQPITPKVEEPTQPESVTQTSQPSTSEPVQQEEKPVQEEITPFTTEDPTPAVLGTYNLPSKLHKHVIGTGGKIIKEIQTKNDVKIDLVADEHKIIISNKDNDETKINAAFDDVKNALEQVGWF
jgi:hypothetical protein